MRAEALPVTFKVSAILTLYIFLLAICYQPTRVERADGDSDYQWHDH